MRFLIPLFLAWSAVAQLPIVPFSVITSTATNADVIGVPGLYEWWVYTDQVTNNLGITNWFGRILGTLATNGASTLRPTNTSDGISYGQDNARQFLTNNPVLDLGSNWTVIVRQRFTRIGYSFSSLYPLWGEFGTSFGVGWIDGAGSPKAIQGWIDYATASHGSASINAIGNFYLDHAMVNSNNVANGVGKMFMYTNAVLVSSSQNAQPNHSRFSAMTWMGPGYNVADVFDGFVKDYLLYTNVLTPAQILTIYQWHTNNIP